MTIHRNSFVSTESKAQYLGHLQQEFPNLYWLQVQVHCTDCSCWHLTDVKLACEDINPKFGTKGCPRQSLLWKNLIELKAQRNRSFDSRCLYAIDNALGACLPAVHWTWLILRSTLGQTWRLSKGGSRWSPATPCLHHPLRRLRLRCKIWYVDKTNS